MRTKAKSLGSIVVQNRRFRPRSVIALVAVLSALAFTMSRPSSATVDDPSGDPSAGAVEVARTGGAKASAVVPDFGLSASPAAQSLAPGQTTSFYVEISSIEGFATPVKLSATGLPPGVTAAFTPATVTPPGSSFVKFSASSAAVVGSYEITITGTAGSVVHSTKATVAVDFALVPMCLVDVIGTVTDDTPQHAPIAGVEVASSGEVVTTDENGQYSLSGLELGPNNSPVQRTFTATKDSPALNHIGSYWSKSATGILICNRVTKVNLEMTRVIPAQLTASVVEGEIVNGDYVTPVAKSPIVPVKGATAKIGSVMSLVSDATGAVVVKDDTGKPGFHLGLANAPITDPLRVAGPSSLPLRHRYWTPASIPLGAINPGQVINVPPVPLIRQCTASLTGSATDASGAPLLDVIVTVKPADTLASDSATAKTNATGKYTVAEALFGFNNKPGAWKLTASKAGYESLLLDSDVVSCGSVSTLNLVLEKSPTEAEIRYGSLTGKVVDKDTNAPIAGIKVQLPGCAVVKAGDCATAPTDAQGRYTVSSIPVGPNTTDVLASTIVSSIPSTPPPDYWSASVDVTVAVGATSTAPDLKLLKRKFSGVTGVVTDSITKAPLPGVKMTTAGVPRVPCGPPCLTGVDGKYAFEKVDLGTNNVPKNSSVVASLENYWPKSSSVKYEADLVKTVDVSLVKVCPGVTIRGTVVNSVTQTPIEGAAITASNLSAAPAIEPAVTDASGQYVLTGVVPGGDNLPRAVAVTASAEGFYSSTLSTTVTCESANISLNFGFKPTITSLAPSSGPAAGGTVVTITGTDLAGIVSAKFDGVPATNVTPVSPTVALATTPAHAPGVVEVQVVTDGGVSALPSPTFTYLGAPPTVTSITPPTGTTAGGTVVTITGTGFAGVAGVTFGSTPAAGFVFLSDTTVTATSPPGTGAVAVAVTTPSGTSTPGAGSTFTYVVDNPTTAAPTTAAPTTAAPTTAAPTTAAPTTAAPTTAAPTTAAPTTAAPTTAAPTTAAPTTAAPTTAAPTTAAPTTAAPTTTIPVIQTAIVLAVLIWLVLQWFR